MPTQKETNAKWILEQLPLIMDKYELDTEQSVVMQIHVGSQMCSRLRKNPNEVKHATYRKWMRKIVDALDGKEIPHRKDFQTTQPDVDFWKDSITKCNSTNEQNNQILIRMIQVKKEVNQFTSDVFDSLMQLEKKMNEITD